MSKLLRVQHSVRSDACEVIADTKSTWRARWCAKELLQALQELAELDAQVRAKDAQLAEMSALWKQVRKLEAA